MRAISGWFDQASIRKGEWSWTQALAGGLACLVMVGCLPPSGVKETQTDSGSGSQRVSLHVASHPGDLTRGGGSRQILHLVGNSFRAASPFRYPDSGKLYFSIEGELPELGKVRDARFMAGEVRLESKLASDAGGARCLELSLDSVAPSLVDGAVHGRLDLNAGNEWRTYDVILPMTIPLPSLPFRHLGTVSGVTKGRSFGADLNQGRIRVNDFQVENISHFPVQLFLRYYSRGNFRLTLRLDEVSSLNPTPDGRYAHRIPTYSQVASEAIGLEIHRPTGEAVESTPEVPNDWIRITLPPGEKVSLSYVMRPPAANVVRIWRNYSKSKMGAPLSYTPFLYYGLRFGGQLPRDVVIASPDVTVEEVNRAFSDLNRDPDRIRFLTRGSDLAEPILPSQASVDHGDGERLTQEEWQLASPRMPEAGSVFEFLPCPSCP